MADPQTAEYLVAWAEQQAEAVVAKYSPPTGPGRWSVLADEEIVSKLLGAVAAGNYLETACDFAGIDRSTLSKWQPRAEAGEEPYSSFFKALKRAESMAEIAAVGAVRDHWGKEWASAMTYLERRKPERWGKRTDDSQAGPRVVVQIGVQKGDVSVQAVTSSQPAQLSGHTVSD